MSKMMLQRILLIAGIVALLIVIVDGAFSIAATIPGTTPARVDHVNAGPYQLTVTMYTYPANAGFALPFSVVTTQPTTGPLTFQVNSIPSHDVDANPVRATFSSITNGIQGAAEITVQGDWDLQIQVNGPSGQGIANVPVAAKALPAIPTWLGWFIGLIPLYVLAGFLLIQLSHFKRARLAKVA